MKNNTIPKHITDMNGKQTTVHVKVDNDGKAVINRLEKIIPNGSNIRNYKDSVQPKYHGYHIPFGADMNDVDFDPKPWLTADGDRVAEVPGGLPNKNDPFFTYNPRDAFKVSKDPIKADAEVYFYNPYKRSATHNPFQSASADDIRGANTGDLIRIGEGKVYTKSTNSDWYFVNAIDTERVPESFFARKSNEGLNVEISTIASSDGLDVVNEFEFEGLIVQHQYLDSSTIRVEAMHKGVNFGEVAYWHTDGVNDILRGNKGTLADVTVALARFTNGENITFYESEE